MPRVSNREFLTFNISDDGQYGVVLRLQNGTGKRACLDVVRHQCLNAELFLGLKVFIMARKRAFSARNGIELICRKLTAFVDEFHVLLLFGSDTKM